MATTADIKNGLCIRYNSDIFKIVEFQHVKPGKGPAFVRTKLKSVTNGKVIDNTFSAGHKIDDVRVENRTYQYLYQDEPTRSQNFWIGGSFVEAPRGTAKKLLNYPLSWDDESQEITVYKKTQKKVKIR